MIGWKHESSVSTIVQTCSKVQNLVLHWPQYWAQLLIHSPIANSIGANTCVRSLCSSSFTSFRSSFFPLVRLFFCSSISPSVLLSIRPFVHPSLSNCPSVMSVLSVASIVSVLSGVSSVCVHAVRVVRGVRPCCPCCLCCPCCPSMLSIRDVRAVRCVRG